MRWFGRPDREYAEEIEEHIAIETRENISRGMSPEDARLAARRTFGNPLAVREQLGSARPLHWIGTLAEDVRYALRSTLRTPLLAGMILITLTAGIGLNTSVFTLLNALLFRAQVDKDPARFFSVFPRILGRRPPRREQRFLLRLPGVPAGHATPRRAGRIRMDHAYV